MYDVSSSSAKIASDFMTREEMAAAEAGTKKKKKSEKKDKKRRKKKTTSELLEELKEVSKKKKKKKKKSFFFFLKKKKKDGDDNDDGAQDRASAATASDRRKEKSESGNLQNLMEKEARYKSALAKAMKLTKEKLYEKEEEEEEQKIVVRKVISFVGDSFFLFFLKIPLFQAPVVRETMSVAEKLAQRAKMRKAAQEIKAEEGLLFSSTTEFLKHVGKEEDELLPDPKLKSTIKRERVEGEIEEGASIVVKKEEEKNEEEVEEGEVEAEPVAGVLEEEPDVGQGLAAALQFLRKNGATAEPESVVARAQDGSVSKKHKAYLEDEEDVAAPKGMKLDLQKYDEFGRPVSRKEAFRQLSQGFHGNAPGAAKQEKRLKQLIREKKVKQKTSTEATFKVLDLVEKRQKETGTAGIKLGIDSAELEEMQEQAAMLVKEKLQAKMGKKKK